jgi:hypothetical protein
MKKLSAIPPLHTMVSIVGIAGSPVSLSKEGGLSKEMRILSLMQLKIVL